MSDVDWPSYKSLYASTEKLIEAAETLIDGASEEKPDDMNLMGREVWAQDFDALKAQVDSTRTALRDAPTEPTKGQHQ